MFDTLLNPPECVRTRAQREVEVMRILQRGPTTIKQLAEETGINPSTTKAMIGDLVKAGMIHRQCGTRKISLDSGEFFHLDDDPNLAWMK